MSDHLIAAEEINALKAEEQAKLFDVGFYDPAALKNEERLRDMDANEPADFKEHSFIAGQHANRTGGFVVVLALTFGISIIIIELFLQDLSVGAHLGLILLFLFGSYSYLNAFEDRYSRSTEDT